MATSVAGGGDQARSCNNGEAHGKNSEFTQAKPKEANWEEKFPKQEPQCAELEILQIAHGDLLLPRRWLIGNPGQNQERQNLPSRNHDFDTDTVHEAQQESRY